MTEFIKRNHTRISSDAEDDDLIMTQKKPIRKRRKLLSNPKFQHINNDAAFPIVDSHSLNNSTKPQALIVVDLDETLINDKYKPFPNAEEFLEQLSHFGNLILWTAGNQEHARQFLKILKKNYFVKTFTKLFHNTKSVSIIKKFCPIYFRNNIPIILIDDNPYNLKNSGYDIAINCKDFYKNIHSDEYSIDYTKMLKVIESRILQWYRQYSLYNNKRDAKILNISSDAED